MYTYVIIIVSIIVIIIITISIIIILSLLIFLLLSFLLLLLVVVVVVFRGDPKEGFRIHRRTPIFNGNIKNYNDNDDNNNNNNNHNDSRSSNDLSNVDDDTNSIHLVSGADPALNVWNPSSWLLSPFCSGGSKGRFSRGGFSNSYFFLVQL